MITYVKIESGVVVQRQPYPEAEFIEAPEGVVCGWLWDGDSFTPPPPGPVPIPQSVTMRQARLALLGAGLLAQVDTAIDALPEPDRTAARIEWEYSQEVRRDKPFVQMLAPALGLDDEALDALFVHAATL